MTLSGLSRGYHHGIRESPSRDIRAIRPGPSMILLISKIRALRPLPPGEGVVENL